MRVMQGLEHGKVYDLSHLFRDRKRLITIGREDSQCRMDPGEPEPLYFTSALYDRNGCQDRALVYS